MLKLSLSNHHAESKRIYNVFIICLTNLLTQTLAIGVTEWLFHSESNQKITNMLKLSLLNYNAQSKQTYLI